MGGPQLKQNPRPVRFVLSDKQVSIPMVYGYV